MSGMDLKRRRVVQGLGAGLLLPALGAPAVIASPRARPKLTDGVQSGDVQGDRALVWSRTDRPARMIVEWDTRSVFSEPRRLVSPVTDERLDYTARIDLRGLPADQSIFYRVRFEDARDGSLSKPWFGHLRSAPSEARNIRFVWSGDTCGQGFGINPDIGGMRIYEAMRRRQPDFFLHSGDTIYADGPIPERIETESGRIWRNRVTEAKSKVAETLDEFRGNYRYNLLDDNLRRFNAEVPQIWQWDDHETTNNWSSSKQLDERYQVKTSTCWRPVHARRSSNTRRCASSARGATGGSTARSPTALCSTCSSSTCAATAAATAPTCRRGAAPPPISSAVSSCNGSSASCAVRVRSGR